MTRKIKVQWLSNSHHVASGYGVQSNLFLKQMLNDPDFDAPIMSNFYGLSGKSLVIEGIETLPTSLDQYGGDAVLEQVIRHKPDVYVILCDAWVYSPQIIAQASQLTDMVMYAPVDHEPMPPKVADSLRASRRVWAMSRHGERSMRAQGLNPDYVPHGVNLDDYAPLDMTELRRASNVPDDWFVVTTVAANKGFPDRKSLRSIFKAWAAWIQRYPKSLLICHSNPTAVHSGLDLNQLRQFYGIPEANIRMPHPYDLMAGTYTTEHVRQLYCVSDVYLNASMGGGFEVPVIDAQACGTPAIVSGLTGQAELGQAGYVIPINPLDDLQYNPAMHAEQAYILPSKILTALEWAYENRGNQALRQGAREFASEYSHTKVYREYLKPTILRYMQERDDREQRQLTRRTLKARQALTVAEQPCGCDEKKAPRKAPVVLSVFNRPEQTARVLATIAKWKPEALFIIGDAPRPGNTADETNCAAVRNIIQHGIDWPCEVKTNYAETNMGADKRLPTGYDWVFSQVDRAIVLEDDLLPEDGFFDYCNELLTRYENDPRVAFISGFNYSGRDDVPTSYRFTRWAGSWGCAFWKRTWDEYKADAIYFNSNERLHEIFKSDPLQRDVALAVSKNLRNWTYDYSWLIARILSGVGICPARNLIKHIGIGAGATHMLNPNDKWAAHPSWPMPFPLIHPERIEVDLLLDRQALFNDALGGAFVFEQRIGAAV